jgi:predicted alpha/beta hydrolase
MYALTALRRRSVPSVARSPHERGEPLTLRTADGVSLAATWYATPARPRAGLVIAAATGVPMGFYRRFALWAASQQVAVLCFDYRGVGRSRPERLRGFAADCSHWALDLDAALAHALARVERCSVLGHSIGGFLAPVCEHAPRLQRLLLVGAQSAYWRDWPHPQRWPMAALWHGAMPAVTWACGYFPGRALSLGEDLPRGVAMQWAQRPWRDPFANGLVRERYGRALPPVHLLAAADDSFATDAAMQRLHDALTASAVTRHRIEPAAAARRRLGHFGLFRDEARVLWPRLLALAVGEQEVRA